MTLINNFGTFLLYMITCWIAMVAFREHHTFNEIKHLVIPVFGTPGEPRMHALLLIGPFMVSGMSWKEQYIALGVCAVWGILGPSTSSGTARPKAEKYCLAANRRIRTRRPEHKADRGDQGRSCSMRAIQAFTQGSCAKKRSGAA
jgi:hypothetical protein